MSTSGRVSQKAGLSPGTPVFVGEKKVEEVRITVIDYDADNYEMKDLKKVEECYPYQEKPTITWINVDGLHEVEVAQDLGKCYGIHPLIIEDILNTNQRTKVDIFDDYIFIVFKMLTYNGGPKALDMEQVSLVFGENFVVTFQEQGKKGDTFGPVRDRIKNDKGKIRKMGADYLSYTLLDSVVDNYFKALENIGEEIEDIEEELVTNPTPATLHGIHRLKKEMLLLRRSVWPLREIINELQREETTLIKQTTNIYLRDIYDHIITVIDTVETYRETISGMLDVYLSSISNRMNEIIKVLTIYSVIFIPLTFIAGVYGMNFNTDKSPFNMPELNWYLGYPFALGLMAVVVISMLVYFMRKKWM
ncbi:MAG: magnesium/cobalt transporter CorA [Nitrospirae bacterium]|nr:magnesium/cobalt transporter CorA [Nitrospirota bacterium]